MSPKAQLAYYALWFAHPALQLVVLGLMLWRKQYRAFPVFFSYIAFQIVAFAVTFPLLTRGQSAYTAYVAYFYAYWAITAISVFIGFGVIHEVFQDVFRPYHTLRDLGSVLFKWAGLVMLMVALVVAASTNSATEDPLVAGIVTLQRSVRVVQCGLVLFLLVFSRYLGTHWKQTSFGIALGFGVFASVELSLVALSTLTGTVEHQAITSFVNMVAYNVTILVWAGYMGLRRADSTPAKYTLRTQRWEEGLNALQHPHASDSLIPMFESMVDRALSRTDGDPDIAQLSHSRRASAETPRRGPEAEYPPLPQQVGSKS
jgi:hypothetical protein